MSKYKVRKFNPYHDEIGRFTFRDAAAGVSGYSKQTSIRVGGKTIITSDVLDAVRALNEGRKVQFRSVREVGTLLSKLAELAQEAMAAGQEAKTYDLCSVSVRGTNLFCAQSKGVPRLQMPQLKGEAVPGSLASKKEPDRWGDIDMSAEFRADLEKSGVKIEDATEEAHYLKASQSELNGVKVAKLAGLIKQNKLLDERLFVSRDNYVVDGHHRWAAIVGVDAEDGRLGDAKIKIARVDMDILDLLDYANKFGEKVGLKRQSVGKSEDCPTCGIDDTECRTGNKYKYESILKANPYHDARGRFTTRDGDVLGNGGGRGPSEETYSHPGMIDTRELRSGEYRPDPRKLKYLKALEEANKRPTGGARPKLHHVGSRAWDHIEKQKD